MNSAKYMQKTDFKNSKQMSLPLEYHLKEDDILYFLHIQKTAGTTIMNILDSYFDLDSIYPEQFWNKLLPKFPHDFTKYKLVRGHFGYGVHRILPKKPVYITMLRDPIERTISDYEHIRRDKIKAKKPVPKNETILDALKDPKTRRTFVNPQTGYIGLDLDIVKLTRTWEPQRQSKFIFRTPLKVATKKTPEEELLSNAKRHLDDFAFVGIVEKFEESLFLLYYTFGWKPLSADWKLNVDPKRSKRDEITSEALEEIKKCTKLDEELYKYANEIFEMRYSVMIENLKEKYYEPAFEKIPFGEMMYKMLEKNYEEKTNSSPTLLRTIDYDFRSKIVGSGWYWREILHDTGEAFRWTGPGNESTIEFPLVKEEDLVIQFRVMRAIIPQILDSLRIKVNDFLIGTKVLYRKSGRSVFEGMIPKSALKGKSNFTRISFEIEKTVNPNEVNPLDPTNRALGIAIDKIRIIPAKSYDKQKDQIQTQVKSLTKNSLTWTGRSAAIRLGQKLKT